MRMVEVESSNIDAVGYDPTEMKMRVRFNNGSEYEYDNVPVSVYDELIAAVSVGSYFNAFVRDHYTYTRL